MTPRRTTLTTLGTLAVWLLTSTCGSAPESGVDPSTRSIRSEPLGHETATLQEHPNIILILTDDQGFGDLGSTGNPVLRTPALDALAAASPQVARCYVSPVCSPTRASLMTGRYAYRTRVVDTWVGRSMMEPDEVTLAEVLSGAGYRTGIFGKWHLGDCFPMRPIDQGFDQALVHRGGGLAQPSEPPENERRYNDPILFANGEQVQTEGYCTDVYFDAALDFIDRSLDAERPFFAYVATNAPHDPLHDVPEELYREIATRDLDAVANPENGRPDADRTARTYAMIENIDVNLGRLLARLDERGIAEDTLVVFLNDNGPLGGRYNAGLRGTKTEVHEGGVRTPLFVRWPGVLDPATRVAPALAHIDLFPTLLEAAGVDLPAELELDGRSAWPLLTGAEDADREWPARELVLQVHRGNTPLREHNFAVIGERWKLVRASGFGRQEPAADASFELFDLTNDPGEEHDQAGLRPALVAELRAVYRRWFDDVSNTRVDNFAPPAIVVGVRDERITTLTRQDWRVGDAGGWGQFGQWRLRCDEPRTVRLRLRFLEPRRVERARVTIEAYTAASDTRESDAVLEIHAEAASLDAGRLELPAGDFWLRVVCEDAQESFSPHQVELLGDDPER